jgi:hypothetical protein
VNQSFSIDFNEPSGDLLPKEIAYVSAIRLPGEGEPIWGMTNAAWVGWTDHRLIQATLDRKEPILAGYESKLVSFWILIVCDGNVGSSLVDLHKEISEERYESSFDRGFVLNCAGRYAEPRLRDVESTRS